MMKQYIQSNLLLAVVLLAVFLKGLVWAALVPIWHFPDEQAHFAQVSHFVETGDMPPTGKFDLSKEILLSERLLGTERDGAGNNKYTYHPEFNIEYSQDTTGVYEDQIAQMPHGYRKEMVRFESASYPPLYYWLGSLFYGLSYNGNLFDRVLAVRLFNVILSVFYAVVCYMFFKELFPSWKIKALIATIVVVFHPMFSFVSAGINSDNLFNLLYLLGMYIGAKLLYRPLTLRYVLLMFFVFVLAVKTKPHGLLLLSVYSFPIIYKLLKKELKLSYSAALVFGGTTVVSKVLADIQAGRQVLPDASLIYLVSPNLSIVDHALWSLKHTYREILPWYWGVFRWLSLALPRDVNRVINRVLVIGAIALAIGIYKEIRKKEFKNLLPIAYLIYVSASYFFILFLWDYLFTRSHGFSFGIQGRYYFPMIAAHIGLLMWGFFSVSSKKWYQRLVMIGSSLSMIVLSLIALYTVTVSYFGIDSIQTFFVRASQYKPLMFKSPWLESYTVAYFFVLVVLGLYLVQSIMKNHETH